MPDSIHAVSQLEVDASTNEAIACAFADGKIGAALHEPLRKLVVLTLKDFAKWARRLAVSMQAVDLVQAEVREAVHQSYGYPPREVLRELSLKEAAAEEKCTDAQVGLAEATERRDLAYRVLAVAGLALS